MRIGLVQMDISWENKDENIKKAESMIKEAVENNIDYLLFPELSLTGFSMNATLIGEDIRDSKTIRQFSNLSKQYGIYVGFGFAKKVENKAHNCYVIMDRKGDILANYAKIHPFSYGEEGMHYIGGEKIVSAHVMDMKTTPFICYDLRFPEIFQLASKDSHLITIAANWPMNRREHWITLLKARAIENQCYIAGVNRVGEGNGLQYSGDSVIVNPYGEIISKSITQEGIVYADISVNEVEDYRESFSLKEDRKELLYYRLFQTPI